MVQDLERRLVELRFVEGIEKVEHVPYPTGDQFWVRFNRPLDFRKLEDTVKKHGYLLVKFASLPSKLPRGLSEMLWDGVTNVIVKKIGAWSKLTSRLGFEPDGIAKCAIDLHGPYQIFIAREEEGVQILYEYLELKYVPPAPPKVAIPPTPPTTVANPTQPAPKPAAPIAPAVAKPAVAPQASAPIPTQQAPSQTTAQAAKPTDPAVGQSKNGTAS